MRFIYYANKVLDIIEHYPSKSIVEIGAGYGGFCATIQIIARHRAIKLDSYFIFDLPNVLNFQRHYLRETIVANKYFDNIKYMYAADVARFKITSDFAISFYALGEFDDATKKSYIENIISNVAHGLVIWNPHSGSGDSLDLLRSHQPNIKVQTEFPLTSINNQEVTW
jgi:hypothetical protein